MNLRDFAGRRSIGTVKKASATYEERILESTPLMKQNPMMDLPETPSRPKVQQRAKSEMCRYRESVIAAESELSKVIRTVKDLALQFEDSRSILKTPMRDVEMLQKLNKRENNSARSANSLQHAEVTRELENVKWEMSKLKLDAASVFEEKARVEKESDGSSSGIRSYSGSVEVLKKEIEEANEEQVLVELSRIEALEEFQEFEAQIEKQASEHLFRMEEYRTQVEDTYKQIRKSKELESDLAETLSEVNILQNRIKIFKAIERKEYRNDSFQHPGKSMEKAAELEGSPQLKSVTEELEVAKKELEAIKEEGFQLMTKMDIIRNELKHVAEESAWLKKAESKAGLTIQNLNSKLLRAKSKLEAATKAEEKTKSIVAGLNVAFDQLRTEVELAKKEKALIAEETADVKAEIQKIQSETDITEGKLVAAMKELEAVKSSESLALDHLQTLTESIMKTRASTSHRGSSITISKFEYGYLTGRAVGVEEIADKKVAAAQAWIEALRASEREILIKLEAAQREIFEKRAEEEREANRTKRSLSSKRVNEGELTQVRNWKQKREKTIESDNRNWKQKREKTIESDNMQLASPSKQARVNGNLTPSGRSSLTPTRRSKLTPNRRFPVRGSVSPAVRTTPRSKSYAIRKRTKVMPNLKIMSNLAKFFGGR